MNPAAVLRNPWIRPDAVEDRYGAAAHEREACLCTPVGFDPALLKVIPDEVVERDYGCGDPTRWVRRGDRVLDLGSGSGKNAFICSQVVGADGWVTGVDRNPDMLSLSRQAAPEWPRRSATPMSVSWMERSRLWMSPATVLVRWCPTPALTWC